MKTTLHTLLVLVVFFLFTGFVIGVLPAVKPVTFTYVTQDGVQTYTEKRKPIDAVLTELNHYIKATQVIETSA